MIDVITNKNDRFNYKEKMIHITVKKNHNYRKFKTSILK